MSSMKDIKQRISNVGTTRQIIRAMDMVAATKLNKARQRLEGIRPLNSEIRQRIADVARLEETENHVFAARRQVKNTAYVVMTSNKGLCGGYNVNVSELALKHMNEGKNEKIIVVGTKGQEYFRRHKKHVHYRITDTREAQIYDTAGQLGELVTSLYLSGEVDEVYLAYTHFETTLSHLPRLERLLPLPLEGGGPPGEDRMMKYGPDIPTFIDHLVPMYLQTYFFAASAEAVTCEHAARMVNMDSAGKNATEVIDDLKRMYNRKRQAAITQELNEIVGGANILE